MLSGFGLDKFSSNCLERFVRPGLVGSHKAAVQAFPPPLTRSKMGARRDAAHRGNLMNPTFEKIITHDDSDDCPVCRAQDIVNFSLVPAVAAWEEAHQMPRHSLAVHRAASLMAFMIRSGVVREDIEEAVAHILDDYEMQMAEEGLLGGPHQGTA
jgi:hypothetical protein